MMLSKPMAWAIARTFGSGSDERRALDLRVAATQVPGEVGYPGQVHHVDLDAERSAEQLREFATPESIVWVLDWGSELFHRLPSQVRGGLVAWGTDPEVNGFSRRCVAAFDVFHEEDVTSLAGLVTFDERGMVPGRSSLVLTVVTTRGLFVYRAARQTALLETAVRNAIVSLMTGGHPSGPSGPQLLIPAEAFRTMSYDEVLAGLVADRNRQRGGDALSAWQPRDEARRAGGDLVALPATVDCPWPLVHAPDSRSHLAAWKLYSTVAAQPSTEDGGH